jgi:hypothetical protein
MFRDVHRLPWQASTRAWRNSIELCSCVTLVARKEDRQSCQFLQDPNQRAGSASVCVKRPQIRAGENEDSAAPSPLQILLQQPTRVLAVAS